MPRGHKYSEEMRAEARRLRREGWSLDEIAKKLGPPKNTLIGWVGGIELTPAQLERIAEKEKQSLVLTQGLGGAYHRQARLDRIKLEQDKAEVFLNTLDDIHQVNHIAAAMLYLGEGAKSEGAFCFANSDPQLIKYWVYLLRTSFEIDEAKFRVRIVARFDQSSDELEAFWLDTAGIATCIKTFSDARTEGKPTLRTDYKGVCKVHYYDVSIRRYLDALAHGLMARAVGAGRG